MIYIDYPVASIGNNPGGDDCILGGGGEATLYVIPNSFLKDLKVTPYYWARELFFLGQM